MSPKSAEPSTPNVVLLCFDSLRKDYYDENAPRLRRLADVRFEGMRAMSSWSVPSHASMFTGSLPRETGVHAYDRDMSKIEGDTWLSELEGYRTVGVSSNVYAGPVFGFDRLFSEFVPISQSRRLPEGMDVQEHIMDREGGGVKAYLSFLRAALTHDHPLHSILNGLILKADDVMRDAPFRKPFDFGAKAIVRELEERLLDSDRPVFAFANIMDTHTPHTPFRGMSTDSYTCSSDFTTDSYETKDVNLAEGIEGFEDEVQWFRELYAATTSYVDRVVADFVQRVQSKANRETVFIVTADHGENLGYEDDGYLMHHSSSLSEGLLHVPFDIVGASGSRDTVTELASHRELGGIVRALIDREPVDEFTTKRAEAEIIGPSSEDYPKEDGEHWSRAMHAVYVNDRKYVRDGLGTQDCWDVGGSPCKQRKVDIEIPDDVFGISFEEWLDAVDATSESPSEREISAAAEERLRDFGYL